MHATTAQRNRSFATGGCDTPFRARKLTQFLPDSASINSVEVHKVNATRVVHRLLQPRAVSANR